MSYFYITYLEPVRTNDLLIPDIAEYDFETYRKLNNFCEVKIQEVKAPNINKALDLAYQAHPPKTNPFVEKPNTNIKDRAIKSLRASVKETLKDRSYDTNTTNTANNIITDFLKKLNINNPCEEDNAANAERFYNGIIRTTNQLRTFENNTYQYLGENLAGFQMDDGGGKALSERDVVLINNVYNVVLNKLPILDSDKPEWDRICKKYEVLFNLKVKPDGMIEVTKSAGNPLISKPNFEESDKKLVKLYQSFIEYSMNYIQGKLDYGADKIALTQYLLDFAYDIFIGDAQYDISTIPDNYELNMEDNMVAIITSFMIKLKLRYQAMNLENKKQIRNHAIQNEYKKSGLQANAVNNGEKRLKFCLKLFNIPEIEVQDWKYGTPSSFIQLAPYFYGSSVVTNYSQNMITFSRAQTFTTINTKEGKCKYGRGWLNQWNREVFENRQKLVNAIRQGADVSQNEKVKGLDVYFIEERDLGLTKDKFPNIICVMQSTVSLCSSDVIARQAASGKGPTLLKMGQPLYTATINADPKFLHTKDELLSMWKYYWSGKCNMKYSVPVAAISICRESTRQPCGIGDSNTDKVNKKLYLSNKVANVQSAINNSKDAIVDAVKNMPNLTDMDYTYVEYKDPEVTVEEQGGEQGGG